MPVDAKVSHGRVEELTVARRCNMGAAGVQKRFDESAQAERAIAGVTGVSLSRLHEADAGYYAACHSRGRLTCSTSSTLMHRGVQ